jgi:hypothetical protein
VKAKDIAKEKAKELSEDPMLQVQGKGEAVIVYRKALITREMRYHWLSRRVNNTVKKTCHRK